MGYENAKINGFTVSSFTFSVMGWTVRILTSAWRISMGARVGALTMRVATNARVPSITLWQMTGTHVKVSEGWRDVADDGHTCEGEWGMMGCGRRRAHMWRWVRDDGMWQTTGTHVKVSEGWWDVADDGHTCEGEWGMTGCWVSFMRIKAYSYGKPSERRVPLDVHVHVSRY